MCKTFPLSVLYRKPYRSLGLFWAGSLLSNMVVFVAGIAIGEACVCIPPPPLVIVLIDETSVLVCSAGASKQASSRMYCG